MTHHKMRFLYMYDLPQMTIYQTSQGRSMPPIFVPVSYSIARLLHRRSSKTVSAHPHLISVPSSLRMPVKVMALDCQKTINQVAESFEKVIGLCLNVKRTYAQALSGIHKKPSVIHQRFMEENDLSNWTTIIGKCFIRYFK